MAKTILIQFAFWALGLSILLCLVSRLMQKATRVKLPLARLMLPILLLAFLLALIPNLDFKGPGPGGGGGSNGHGDGPGAGGEPPRPTSPATVDLVLRIERRGIGLYELRIERESGEVEGPVLLDSSPASRREVVALLRRWKEARSAASAARVRIDMPPSLSDVSGSLLEDLLRSEGLMIAAGKS